MDGETIKTIAIVAASIIALFTFSTAVLEFVRQGRQTRAQQFIDLERRFRENESFAEMIGLLEKDDPALATWPIAERREMLAFFEEIALMTNSRLLRKEVAHYMFGYYIDLCFKSEHIWSGFNRDDTFWTVFNDFHKQMQAMTQTFRYDRKIFRF